MQKNSSSEKCYSILRKVPKGKVTTYKEIAHVLGTKAYRAVGTAMNKNPYSSRPHTTHNKTGHCLPRSRSSPIVACHRVVNSNGKIGGFASGTKNKIKMLKKEGVLVKKGRIQNFNKLLHRF